MMDMEDGWLYVMMSREEIIWEMDVDGVSGYVRADEVEQFVCSNRLMLSD